MPKYIIISYDKQYNRWTAEFYRTDETTLPNSVIHLTGKDIARAWRIVYKRYMPDTLVTGLTIMSWTYELNPEFYSHM